MRFGSGKSAGLKKRQTGGAEERANGGNAPGNGAVQSRRKRGNPGGKRQTPFGRKGRRRLRLCVFALCTPKRRAAKRERQHVSKDIYDYISVWFVCSLFLFCLVIVFGGYFQNNNFSISFK